jgi:hypothetical protein
MTDDRRSEIERRFDGESDESETLGEFADDPEAQRYLDRLTLLRELAQRHDPASTVPRRTFALPDHRPRRFPWWIALTTAAAIVIFCAPLFFRGGNVPPVVVGPTGKPSVRPIEPPAGRPPLEVELYGWANTPSRAPRQAARLVLSPAFPSKKRSPADEILALELANEPTQARGAVQRFAVSRGSKSSPSPKAGSRSRTTLPEV